jgi:hypothetical protein
MRAVEGAPVRTVEGAPVRSVEGAPVRAVEGAPVRAVEGAPVRAVEGAPVRAVEGVPHRCAVEGAICACGACESQAKQPPNTALAAQRIMGARRLARRFGAVSKFHSGGTGVIRQRNPAARHSCGGQQGGQPAARFVHAGDAVSCPPTLGVPPNNSGAGCLGHTGRSGGAGSRPTSIQSLAGPHGIAERRFSDVELATAGTVGHRPSPPAARSSSAFSARRG